MPLLRALERVYGVVMSDYTRGQHRAQYGLEQVMASTIQRALSRKDKKQQLTAYHAWMAAGVIRCIAKMEKSSVK